MSAVRAVVIRELVLHARRPGTWLHPLSFLALSTLIFALGVGPGAETLARIAPGIVWSGVTLAAMLTLENLLRDDLDDGVLEQMALSHVALPVLVIAKVAAHWLASLAPMALAAPLVGAALGLGREAVLTLFAALLLGTPVLSLLGAVGAALTLGAQRGGLLMLVIMLPMLVPVLVFGAGAVDVAAAGLSPRGPLLLLGSILVLALTLTPFAAAAAIRLNLGQTS